MDSPAVKAADKSQNKNVPVLLAHPDFIYNSSMKRLSCSCQAHIDGRTSY